MSQASSDNGDTRTFAIGDIPAVVPGGPSGDPDGRPILDYRRRGLRTEPSHDVPATSARMDHGQRHRRRRLLAKVAAFVAVAALAVLLLQAFVVQPFFVPGDAMAPTLQAGDRILVLKSGLFEGPIRSGDVVVFHPPRTMACTVVGARSGDLVRRVVALPGEVISSVGDTIFVDGRPLSERGWYDPHFGQVDSTPIRSTTLAPGQYFVMADNRSDACDSRVFGPISKSSVVGKGIAVVGRHGHVFFGTL
jgi:signal peptidase I